MKSVGIDYNKHHETNIKINKQWIINQKCSCFMIQGQIALKKEPDGNDNKLIGTRNKCNTQTVY